PVHVPGKEGMIVRSARFLDLEMPMEALKTWITPVPHFFVRNHMHEPSTLDPSTWVLTISGEVEQPLTLSLTDLKKLELHSVINTLECAGNGRAFQQRSEEHTSELQSLRHLVCRLLLEKKKR